MKDGWEIKKLGDVCTITMGQSPSSDTYNDSEGLPFFQGNADFGKIYPSIRVYCNAPIRIAEINDILISVRAPIGAINIANCKCCIGRGLASIRKGNTVIDEFIYHSLLANREKLIAQGTGSTFKSIGRDILKNLPIPIPPLPEQERIVSELDCINGILEKKREQIKELDALAQSIFYHMFGDPVINEKGWEVKKFAECYKLKSGNGLSAKDIINGDYPVYGGNGIVGYHNEFNLEGENIIIGRVGALCGNVRNVIGQVFVTDNAFILSKNVENDSVFLQYLLAMHNLRSYAREAMQPVISNTSLKNIEIILPPLSLQQSFATKIEAIEKQKELIKRSIAEVETLLASRMQHHFG